MMFQVANFGQTWPLDRLLAILLLLLGSLQHLIVFGFQHALIDESLGNTPALFILTVFGSNGHDPPAEPGNGSQRSDSGADSSSSSFGSISDLPVSSRLACSQSDFEASCAARPSIKPVQLHVPVPFYG